MATYNEGYGKTSQSRVSDKKKFNDNYDKIFGKKVKPTEPPVKPAPIKAVPIAWLV